MRGKHTKIYAPTMEQYYKMKEILPWPHNLVWAIGCRTGLRISEILSLRRESLDLIREEIIVLKKDTKNKSARCVPMHTDIKKLIEGALVGKFMDEFIFGSSRAHGKGMHRSVVNKAFLEAQKKLGIQTKFGTHGMRKFFVTTMYHGLGRDPVATAHAVGLKGVANIMHYVHKDENHIKKVILENSGPEKYYIKDVEYDPRSTAPVNVEIGKANPVERIGFRKDSFVVYYDTFSKLKEQGAMDEEEKKQMDLFRGEG